MKKKYSISIAIVLAFMLSLSFCASAAFFPIENPYITSKSGYIEPTGNGNIRIHFSVSANNTMSTLGASSIALYKSNGEYVTTFSSNNYSNMLTSDTYTYSSSISYKAVSGQTYYAVITLYADNGASNSTAIFTTASATA